jgi:hypothetical protein
VRVDEAVLAEHALVGMRVEVTCDGPMQHGGELLVSGVDLETRQLVGRTALVRVG